MKERCRKVKPDIEQKLNEEEWRSLIRLIDSLFPNVSVFMKENTLGLTKTETKICYLSFLDLHLNEEAVLWESVPIRPIVPKSYSAEAVSESKRKRYKWVYPTKRMVIE